MADPRFYDNRGPFIIGDLCVKLGLTAPDGADLGAEVHDVAGLAQAGPQHISYFAPLGRLHRSPKKARAAYLASKAGWCIVTRDETEAPSGTVLLRAKSVMHAYVAAALLFYPDSEMRIEAQPAAVHPTAVLEDGVVLAPGAVIGEGCEIGSGTRIGANAVIGRRVTIGRNCEIGPHASIAFAHIGDEVVIQAGARLGGSGFGFASDMLGHAKVPQLGRIIVQDRAEIGANTTIDRGAMADTVVGEGAKIDNLVQIGHNTVVGRHAIVVGQAGISGSVVLGQFSVVGGMVGIADHAEIGDGVQVAAMAGVTANLPAGHNYGGFPAKPVHEWRREMATLSSLSRKRRPEKKSDDE